MDIEEVASHLLTLFENLNEPEDIDDTYIETIAKVMLGIIDS
jgi:hypothetical protein